MTWRWKTWDATIGVGVMLREPTCSERGCKYFEGVRRPDGTERTEVVVCKAFPRGIPDEIAYGDNLHADPYPGDGGTRFEKS